MTCIVSEGELNSTHSLAWAVWLPGSCQVGWLVRRSGGPPRQMLK